MLGYYVTDPDELVCECCGDSIEPGDHYFTYKGHICCGFEECIKEILFKEHEDDFEKVYVETEEDKYMAYCDHLYEEMAS